MVLYVGAPVLVYGLLMLTRGWIYTVRPEGKVAQRRKRRNLKLGFTTDMALFGRKVRRLGLLIALAGGAMVGWAMSERVDAAAVATPSASVDAGAAP